MVDEAERSLYNALSVLWQTITSERDADAWRWVLGDAGGLCGGRLGEVD